MSINPPSYNIVYQITPIDPAAHVFEVVLNITHPDPKGQILQMPVWIPGSYKIRDFSKNITNIQAYYQLGVHQTLATLQPLDKHSWQVEPYVQDNPSLTVVCRIYAYDLSVRTIYLDEYYALINFSSLCLSVKGQETNPCKIKLFAPCTNPYNHERIQPNNWEVITSLPRSDDTQPKQFGDYYADNYDALIDYPVQLAPKHLIQWGEFTAYGALHTLAIVGNVPNLDMARLIRDTQAICSAQIHLFDPDNHVAAFLDSHPNTHYTFMTQAVGDGYGGLEHRSSTALICKRSDLPSTLNGVNDITTGYQQYLGLVSHEYFHTWHVKRIKPAIFINYDLTQENYTPLLWLFEGFTAYYDDLILVRAGVITAQQYLEQLSKTISHVLRTPARLVQNLADSSFNAWIKYYNPDENSPNVASNYYTQGSLVALYLDLHIRLHTQSYSRPRSLDDVMRLLWKQYGEHFYRHGHLKTGINLSEVYTVFEQATDLTIQPLIESLTHTAGDIPLKPLLEQFGITWVQTAASETPSLGASIKFIGNEVHLATVYTQEAAYKAGLSGGDCLIALNGLRVTPTSLPVLLKQLSAGQAVHALAWRRDELISTHITLDQPPNTQVQLQLNDNVPIHFNQWLAKNTQLN